VAETVYTRTIRRAIETLGGVVALAGKLGVTVAEIDAWAAGVEDPPPAAFLAAIDIVAQCWSTPRGVAVKF
jgi:DNA-binding transcriptional regulator YdaS (Cro superfamily)